MKRPSRSKARGLRELARLDAHGVDQELLALHEPVEIEAQRSDVLRQLLGGLLERDEDAGLARLARPCTRNSIRGASSAARAAAHERRPALGKPPPVISSRPRMPVAHLGSAWRASSPGRRAVPVEGFLTA
jgi:hypothetical protein